MDGDGLPDSVERIERAWQRIERRIPPRPFVAVRYAGSGDDAYPYPALSPALAAQWKREVAEQQRRAAAAALIERASESGWRYRRWLGGWFVPTMGSARRFLRRHAVGALTILVCLIGARLLLGDFRAAVGAALVGVAFTIVTTWVVRVANRVDRS